MEAIISIMQTAHTLSSSIATLDINDSLDSLIISTKSTYSAADSTGLYHNLMIIEAYELYGDSMLYKNSEELIAIFSDVAYSHLGIEATSTEISETSKVTDEIHEALLGTSSFAGFCNGLRDKYPGDSDYITILQNYMGGLSQLSSSSAKREYTQQVLSLIDAQISTTSTRQALTAGVNTGFATNRLWDI